MVDDHKQRTTQLLSYSCLFTQNYQGCSHFDPYTIITQPLSNSNFVCPLSPHCMAWLLVVAKFTGREFSPPVSGPDQGGGTETPPPFLSVFWNVPQGTSIILGLILRTGLACPFHTHQLVLTSPSQSRSIKLPPPPPPPPPPH